MTASSSHFAVCASAQRRYQVVMSVTEIDRAAAKALAEAHVRKPAPYRYADSPALKALGSGRIHDRATIRLGVLLRWRPGSRRVAILPGFGGERARPGYARTERCTSLARRTRSSTISQSSSEQATFIRPEGHRWPRGQVESTKSCGGDCG